MQKADYDLIIAGGGPAGLTAGLYAARARLRTLLVEKMAPGGQAATTFYIENYPGFAQGISGPDLTQAMEEQAKRFGLEVTYGEVKGLSSRKPFWELEVEDRKVSAKAVIVATGVEPRKLGVPGEETLRGRGVSYCATCDGPFFKDQDIGVIGGGDSAVEEALYLTRFAKRVYLVHRRDALRAEKILQERALENPKIEILWDTVVTKVVGDSGVEGLELQNVKTQGTRSLKVGGVFFYVGLLSNAGFLRGTLNLDDQGYVLTDDTMATSAVGIFAAGDVRKKLLRQIATAVGDGAMAAFAAERYIESGKWP
ncbi:MAG: thioredoxin-disulfide reductase [Deltaproteobacteria bacterium]|jgi:thioredoxin reductase (NADPH)|nr:thioredoxin-disulfide reductase [Deltaproteobacteria bacterium]